MDETELSETQMLQRDYWTALKSVVMEVGDAVAGNPAPWPRGWLPYPIGRTGFRLNAVMRLRARQIRSELYISGSNAKAFFHLLSQQKDTVEQELGYPLEWEELPGGNDSRIAIYLDDADPQDEKDWPRQHEWLAKHLNDLHRVFANRVRDLDADAWYDMREMTEGSDLGGKEG